MKTNVETADFPGCCKAVVICNFGGGEVGEPQDRCYSEEDIISDLRPMIKEMLRRRKHIVFATTTSRQDSANSALEKLGFKEVSSSCYDAYDENDDAYYGHYVYGWVLNLSEYKG